MGIEDGLLDMLFGQPKVKNMGTDAAAQNAAPAQVPEAPQVQVQRSPTMEEILALWNMGAAR